jgi:hypothetical protein
MLPVVESLLPASEKLQPFTQDWYETYDTAKHPNPLLYSFLAE